MNKTHLPKIQLPANLLLGLKSFSDKHNEDFHVCILRTLEKGLLARRRNKELYRKALYRALEETEEKLRGSL